MNISEMTQSQFERLPRRKWDEDIGTFDSLIILPAKVSQLSLLKFRLWSFLSRHIHWVKEPEIYEIRGMHDSGYRCMDVVAVKGDEAICLLSGRSDVIHIEGIGGYGFDWLHRFNKVPESVPPRGWSIDCLRKSGLLRLFCHRKLRAGAALSSFEIYSEPTEES